MYQRIPRKSKRNKKRNKKALSDVVAYVLLIAITVSLSILVYGWLRFYVGEEVVNECPLGVNVIISDYSCFIQGVGNLDNRLVLEVKNKGRFTVDGFVLRVHNRTDADFGVYILNDTGQKILPGESVQVIGPLSGKFNFSRITLIEIQPFVNQGDNVSCKSVATQKITCMSS